MATLQKNVTGVKHDGTRQLHDLPVNMLSEWLRRAYIPQMGGDGSFNRTCKWLFAGVANRIPELDPDSPAHVEVLRYREGMIPRSHA